MSATTVNTRAYATVVGTAATFVTVGGRPERMTAHDGEDIRHTVIQRATDEARRSGTAVELLTSGDRGDHRLLIDPTGAVTPLTLVAQAAARPAASSADTDGVRGEVREQAPWPAADAPRQPATEPPSRPTFLAPAPAPSVPATGWHRLLAGLGIHVKPSAAMQRRAHDAAVASRHWAGCRTLAVANGKGGVGKTMTCAMLAAVYAREGGGNVLAWDNNDTRGTLGWRTEQGLYDTTLRDLLPEARTLLEGGVGVADITRYVHHQVADRYDVLRSNPELLAADQRIKIADFDLLLQVAARFYRMVIFDSGNDESAGRWLRMIDRSYQLVIPSLATPESAESASLLLDALRGRDERSAALADHAVVIVTQAEPSPAWAHRIADGFQTHVRAVHIIPFDPGLKSGPLRFDALRPGTRDAWVAAAAAVAEEL
ncbi:AAA family ATPase [Microbacterium sp.]|uniref:MinD/ParA family ATP-binding protein n=1 Tax=Microbacterium sp. TaxID=51671 RepID=UPI003A92FC8E